MKYNLSKPWLTLDPWQKKLVLSKEKKIVIVTGRQCGKTTATAQLASETAIRNPKEFILIGAGVIEQTEIIMRKIKDYINSEHEGKIVKQ